MSPCGHGQSQVWSACRCVCQQENPTLKRDDRCVAARAACRVCEVILQQKASTHTQKNTPCCVCGSLRCAVREFCEHKKVTTHKQDEEGQSAMHKDGKGRGCHQGAELSVQRSLAAR